MTLIDGMDNDIKDLQISLTLGECLKESLTRASLENRLKCGVLDCAAVLKSNPENVMLCLLPDVGNENISVHIQHTLIEAFCMENNIRILKIDSFNNLLTDAKYMCLTVNNNDVCVKKVSAEDISCLLAEYPPGELNGADEILLQYYIQIEKRKLHTKPVIHIPE